ncbi:MAG: glycosyltransferase [Anaerolineae bacterium]|nr:glycosyltransferase [Anaerolineae bacterium]
MPRILFLAGATSIHTNRWVNAITNRGYEVHLLSLHPLRDVLDPKVFFYQAPFTPNLGYFTSFLWVRRLIAAIKPDLVHAHYAAGYGTVAALAGFHPTILSVWGYDVYEFPNKSWLHKNLLKFNLARADKILSTSYVMAKETNKYTHKPIEVTPFGIDLSQFKPQKTITDNLFAPQDIVIGTIKTLDEKYGLKYLIQAFRLLKDKYPGLPLKLLIVGGGPQEALLKNLVKELKLTEWTVFTGHILHADIPKYHNALSVYVAPSVLDSESFGVAVIEASACEKPVVVSNIGGLPEVVEDSVSGFVVPPRNPPQLAAAVERLVLDEALRTKMGRAGRERVANLYNWEDNVTQMTKIYNQLLKAR